MTIDFLRLGRMAWERRRHLLQFYAAVGAVTIAVVFVLPRWYTSSVTLVPAPGDGLTLDFSGLGGLGTAVGLGGVPTPQDQLKMVVRSRAVADSIIQRFDLVRCWRLERREQAREKLGEHTLVTTPIEGQVILAVEARSPVIARDMAVAYASCVAREALRLKTSLATRRRVYLEARLGELDRDIALASARVREFEEKNGAISLPEQTRETMKAAGSLWAHVALLETELAATRRYFTKYSQPVVVLRDRIAALKGEIDRLERKGGTLLLKGSELPALKQQHLRLTREQVSLFEVRELLRRVYEQARVEEANPVPAFSVLDAPDLPERHSRPKRVMKVCIALALSMVFSLGYLQWREIRAGRGSQHRARSLAQALSEAT